MKVGDTRKLVDQHWELTPGAVYLHQKFELLGPWDQCTYRYMLSGISADGARYAENIDADSPKSAIDKFLSYYEGHDIKVLSLSYLGEATKDAEDDQR